MGIKVGDYMDLGSMIIAEIDKSASYLSHGGPWKEHKYIKKIGDRYYYEEKTKNGIIDHNLNNLEGVSLFGDKEARKDYIHAKQDVKDLNKTLKAVNKDLKKAIKSNDQKSIDKYTSSKSTIEKASTYAIKNLDKKKDAYNKTRTLDDIPAYLISQGEHKIISILNSLKK